MKKLHYIALSLMAGLSVTTSAQTMDESLRFFPSENETVSALFANPRATVKEGKTNNLPMLAQRRYCYKYSFEKEDYVLYLLEDFKRNELNKTVYQIMRNYSEDGSMTDVYEFKSEYDSQHRFVKYVRNDAYGNDTDWTNGGYALAKYDDIVPEFQTAFESYDWDRNSEDWVFNKNASYFIGLERDTQNRVVLCESWVGRKGDSFSTKYKYEYDENGGNDGHPVTAYSLAHYIGDNYIYTDMKWHKCDNQMTSRICFPSYAQMFHFNSLPASYKLSKLLSDETTELIAEHRFLFDDQERFLLMSIDAPGDNDDFAYVCEYDIDDNGSYVEEYTAWRDANGDGMFQKSEAVISPDNTLTYYYYDANGNCSSKCDYVFNEETQQIDRETFRKDFDYKYIEGNTIKEYIQSSYKYGELVSINKVVYEDFVDRVDVGIKDAESSERSIRIEDGCALVNGSEGAAYVICDIQGRMVKSGIVQQSEVRFGELVPGAYILHIGNGSYKILKK